jgi:serine protease Do
MTNNPGAAGGAVTNRQGALVGLIGKELRNAGNNTWLNHSLPIRELTLAVDDILAGKTRPRSEDPQTKKPAQPWTLALAGLNLVPHVLAKTPPFVEFVQPGSAADKAGLKPDDLILFVNDRAVYTVQSTVEELSFVDRIDPVRLTVHRGQELVDAVLKPVE